MIGEQRIRAVWRQSMILGFPGPHDAAKAASDDTRRISPVMARGGIIGAQHPLVSSTGLSVLAAGGNAVDAAVAAALVASVYMLGQCGLGGVILSIIARVIVSLNIRDEC